MNDALTVTQPTDGTRDTLQPENRISSIIATDSDTPKKTLKVAIVGMAPSSRSEAPFKDTSWEIWGLSNCYDYIPRWNRWFELHDPYTRRDRYPELWKFLTKNHDDGRIIYINQPCDEIPSGEVFPYSELVKEFDTRYFTNNVSWVIAWAMHQGATEIGIYGVDMAQQLMGEASEYAYQRPSCEYFIGLARGRGIKVFVHPKSDVLKASCLYGVEGDQNQIRVKWKARLAEMNVAINNWDHQNRDWNNKVWMYRGALDGVESCARSIAKKEMAVPEEWTKEINRLNGLIREAELKREEANAKKHIYQGAIDDMSWWSQWIYTEWAGEGKAPVCVMCQSKLEQS